MNSSSLPPGPDHPSARVVAFYASLSPESLARIGQVYAEQARFIDPYNDVQGIGPIRQVFEHMFAQLDAPRFEVTEVIADAQQCFLVWNFHFARKGRHATLAVHGGSHLRFAPDGRVAWHRDYWDPAHELYLRIPLLGGVLRWLRRRLSAGASQGIRSGMTG